MTPARFRAIRRIMHWSEVAVAALAEVNDRQVRRWSAGQAAIPPHIAEWLETWPPLMEANPCPPKPPRPGKEPVCSGTTVPAAGGGAAGDATAVDVS